MSILCCYPSSIFLCDHDGAHSPRCHERWFGRHCPAMWSVKITFIKSTSAYHNYPPPPSHPSPSVQLKICVRSWKGALFFFFKETNILLQLQTQSTFTAATSTLQRQRCLPFPFQQWQKFFSCKRVLCSVKCSQLQVSKVVYTTGSRFTLTEIFSWKLAFLCDWLILEVVLVWTQKVAPVILGDTY